MKLCLVVDDSRVVRKVACRILEELKIETAEAEDGSAAYDFCQTKMPDIILLDWNMPIMNGLEFLEKLRAMENGSDPVVIFCTTENDMDHIMRGMQAGANEYIMKPFDSDIIQTKFIQTGVLEG
jgi:two-component system, chemotaxis family, chemotaxis protein CheY